MSEANVREEQAQESHPQEAEDLPAGSIFLNPPTLNDLVPGETRVVQLQRNQMGPSFPPRPCVYLYRRAGKRLFATLLEEVTQ